MPSRDEIIANKTSFADFSSGSISKDFAIEIAELLTINKSICEISFNASDLVDECFEIITDGLLKRNQNNLVLDVDNTNLTENSIPSIKNLIDRKILKTLYIYGVDGIRYNTSAGIALSKYARDHNVNVSFDHPRKRASLGFFDHQIDEHKDINANKLIHGELETKEPNVFNKRH